MKAIIAKFRVFLQTLGKIFGNEDVMISLVIIVACTSSFLLGQHSAQNAEAVRFTMNDIPESTKIEIRNAALGIGISEQPEEKMQGKTTIFGSKNGSKYYFSWCSGASRVKLENRVYYQSEQEAKNAGRDIAASCN
jgi:hypothetical protein